MEKVVQNISQPEKIVPQFSKKIEFVSGLYMNSVMKKKNRKKVEG